MELGFWLKWQMDYLYFLQCFRDTSCHVFDKFFIYITMCGEILIPLIIICLLYWTINKRIGRFVLWSYLFGFLVNLFAKMTACIYRPWILDSRIHPLEHAIPKATGYSFPSGHTAGVMSTWGGVAVSFWNNKIIRCFCFFIILSVMISRNYLGVHTPQDVIFSFIISIFILWGTYSLIKWEEEKDGRDLIVLGGVFTAILITMLYITFKSYPIHYLFGKILYNPCSYKIEAFTKAGFMFGSFLGWFIEKRFIGFNPERGTILKKIARFVLGICILSCLHSAGHLLSVYSWANCGMFIQYFVMGLFVTCIYPFIVEKWNL